MCVCVCVCVFWPFCCLIVMLSVLSVYFIGKGARAGCSGGFRGGSGGSFKPALTQNSIFLENFWIPKLP